MSKFSIVLISVFALASSACGLQVADDGSEPQPVDVNVNVDCADCGSAGAAPVAPCTGGSAGSEPVETGGTGNEPATGGTGSTGAEPATGGDGNDPTDTSCEATYPDGLTAPVISQDSWTLSFSTEYLPPGTTAVEISGNLPGYTWDAGNGISASLIGGRWTAEVPRVPGTYELSYRSSGTWADYGVDEERVACMTQVDKSWLWCKTKTVDGETHLDGCGIRIEVRADGGIVAAGNTGDWE